jgi:uncharacterized membrane protein
MTYILLIWLFSGLAMKFATPKRPSNLFGYQLGSAKKSTAYWKLANAYASTLWIGLSLCLLVLSLMLKGDEDIWIFAAAIAGLAAIYFLTERKLKKEIR